MKIEPDSEAEDLNTEDGAESRSLGFEPGSKPAEPVLKPPESAAKPEIIYIKVEPRDIVEDRGVGTLQEPAANLLLRHQQETVAASSLDEPWKPTAAKKKKNSDITNLFVESDRIAREYARECDKAYERLETERLRLREYEVCERVGQRDQELYLQGQRLEFFKEALNVLKDGMNG